MHLKKRIADHWRDQSRNRAQGLSDTKNPSLHVSRRATGNQATDTWLSQAATESHHDDYDDSGPPNIEERHRCKSRTEHEIGKPQKFYFPILGGQDAYKESLIENLKDSNRSQNFGA